MPVRSWKWGGELRRDGFTYSITPEEERAWTKVRYSTLSLKISRLSDTKQKDATIIASKPPVQNSKAMKWVDDDHWEYNIDDEERKGKNGEKFDCMVLLQCMNAMYNQLGGHNIECAGLVDNFNTGSGSPSGGTGTFWRNTWQLFAKMIMFDNAKYSYGCS